jgi:hypothetical protein
MQIKNSKTIQFLEIARFAAIGQKYGCITTGHFGSHFPPKSGAIRPFNPSNSLFNNSSNVINDSVMNDPKNNKSKWLHIRLQPDQYYALYKKFSSSTCRKFSEYARRVLLDKEVTINQRNQSLDDFMAEMIRLRTELNSIGNNFNQLVKKLHTLQQMEEFTTWILINENSKQILLKKVEEIKQKINSISDQWLQ